MFDSIQTKLLLIISIIFIMTTSAIIFMIQKNVRLNVFKNEEKNIENITNITFLNIESLYRNLLMDKIIQIEQKKQQLKNESQIIEAGLDQLLQIHKKISPAIKKNVISWFKSIHSSSKIFLCDENNKIIFHQDKKLNGINLKDIKDFKSRPLTKGINQHKGRNNFVVFSWNYKSTEDKKLAYLKKISKWGWTTGVTCDISKIEKYSKNKLEFIVSILKNKFPQIKIAETGSLILFDSKQNIMIEPKNKNIILNNNILKRFIKKSNSNSPDQFKIGQRRYLAYTSGIKALKWYISAIVPVEELQSPANILAEKISILTALFFLAGLIIMLSFVKKFSNPLKKLAIKLQAIPDEDFTSDDFSIQIEQSFNTRRKDEIGILTRSFIFMMKRLQENIRKLMEATISKQKIENELKVARDIQLGILPKIFPPFPDKKEFDLHAFLNPAKEVGGDLYDFFLLDDNHLCFTIGDVSGKGVPAALFMAITKTLIKTYSEIEKSPSEIMTKVNSILSKDNPNCMFVTLIIGILNINTGEIKYANAGHNPPVIKTKNKTFFQKGLSGPIAGPIEDIIYTELNMQLQPGDMLFLYTDGVTEAMNKKKELFSNNRLIELIQNHGFKDAKDCVESVEKSVKKFAGGEMQSDDITILTIIFH